MQTYDLAFTFPLSPPAYEKQALATKELVRQVRHFLDDELSISLKGKHVLLAVSGGADSLALVCVLHWLRPIYNHSFSVLHIHHGLRVESTCEAFTVQALCEAWKIPCIIEKIDVAKEAQREKKGIEEMARQLRYELYAKHATSSQAAWICLGHHLGDVQEDVLMRLIRGAGWPALGGMTAYDQARQILRPLLMQKPEALQTLLQEAGLGWAEDASNADTVYLRNRVRHNILPLLQAENPVFPQKIQELWQFAQYDKEHWQRILEDIFKKHNICYQENTVTLPSAALQSADKATRLRLYHFALQHLQKHSLCSTQARARTLLDLDAALIQGRGNTTFQLSGGVHALVKKGSVKFHASPHIKHEA